ncbi:MAG: hypothetical protein IJS95_07550 [Prevotella sp.]|nr:hypothetical protein [Bacteroidaceae bacterium]MBQ7514224.1 hypothetical protein [Prevotella sp.]
MKKLSKFLMAAAAIGALSSCTDDLGVDSGQQVGKADLVGTLNIPVDYELTRAGINENNNTFVWTAGDVVRVFTMEALTYNNFLYNGAGGEQTGSFTKQGDQTIPDDTRYGVTEAANVYAVSSDGEGNALLTMTLPGTCEVSNENGVYKFPIPFWGEVTGTDDALTCDFKFLTSYLRIDMAQLPVGTKAIVLTTHGNPYLVSDNYAPGQVIANVQDLDPGHGYQLAAPVATTGKIATVTDANDEEHAYEDTNDWWDNIAYTTGGGCEAISGTLNATLDVNAEDKGKYLEGVQLAVDPRLVSYDTLRVDVSGITNQVFYLPIVAGTYKQLDVLAVTQDSKYAYRWGGTLLKSYTDTEFKVGTAKTVTMNLLTFDKADLNTLNKTIADNFTTNDNFTRTTVINVEELVNEDGQTAGRTVDHLTGKDYVGVDNDKLYVPNFCAGKLIVNIKKIATNGEDANTFKFGTSANKLIVTDKAAASTSAGKKRTVTINLPKDWEAEDGKGSFVKTSLLTFQTIIGTVERENSTTIEVEATGSDDQFSAGLQNIINTENLYVEEEKTAAIRINNGIKKLTVLNPTKGDVYIYNDNNDNVDGTAETEISDSLVIRSLQAVDIRMDDALAKVIGIKRGAKHWIYTTGKAATSVISATSGDNDQEAYDTHMQSFYTGAGLSDYAWANGYDVATVYTVAQLQSMGEAREGATDPAEQPTEYKVWNKVEWFWLGADKYQWVGPVVTRANFSFDGNNRPIVNMYAFSAGGEDTYETVYVNDPHFCCTSCGRPNVAGKIQTGAAQALTENLGLIRSIIEEGTATIKNVTMQDAQIVNAAVAKAGALVGFVDIAGALTLTDNHIGEVKVDISGDNAGGLIGRVEAGSLTATGNWNIKNGDYENYVKTAAQNAGGMFGSVEVESAVTAENNKVTLTDDIEAGTSYAGGFAGKIEAAGAVAMTNNSVVANDIKAAAGSYAAGQIGYIKANSLNMDQSSVTAKDITATNEYAGGLVGQSDNKMTVTRFTVAVADDLSATEGFVGGIVGQLNPDAECSSYIGSTPQVYGTSTHTATISVGNMAGAQSLGGIIGNNKEYAKVAIQANSGRDGSSGSVIDVNIAKYTMTYPETNPLHWTNVTDRIQYGTIQDIIGLMQANVSIYTENLTTSGWLDDDANKVAVLVNKHIDNLHNSTAYEDRYWGDSYGYIGYSTQGRYRVWAAGDTDWTVVNNELEGGFNYYKTSGY